jgi:hypothetical protein
MLSSIAGKEKEVFFLKYIYIYIYIQVNINVRGNVASFGMQPWTEETKRLKWKQFCVTVREKFWRHYPRQFHILMILM